MAWANFKDKTKDINDPNNYIQGSLQGDMPDPHQISEYWLVNHPNWLQVDDGWIPPAPVPTKAEQVAKLFNDYDTERRKLERYLNDAIATYQDEQYASEVRAEIIALDDKYFNDCEVINNG